MFRANRLIIAIAATIAVMVLMTACGGGGKSVDYEHLRELSWEGTELTIKLGENQSTGCTWTTKPQDDSVIDYSINRKFKLAGGELAKGEAIGTLEAGFAGKGAGTTQIVCTTPVGWDGKGDGYAYIVTVTVKEDGTIENATGEESDAKAAEGGAGEAEGTGDAEGSAQAEMTLESYFGEHPDELKEIQKSINNSEDTKGVLEVSVSAKGNTLTYIYKFKETYSADRLEAAKPDMQKSLDSDEMKTNMQEQIKKIESEYKVSGVKMHMEYQNGDGTKICSADYK